MADSNRNDDDGPIIGAVIKTRTETKKPSMYKVLMLNDDYTPMDFVVLVLERTIAPDYKEAVPVLQLDLQILVMLGGKERTEAEYSTLFAGAGLQLSAVCPLGDSGQFSVFEGVPA